MSLPRGKRVQIAWSHPRFAVVSPLVVAWEQSCIQSARLLLVKHRISFVLLPIGFFTVSTLMRFERLCCDATQSTAPM